MRYLLPLYMRLIWLTGPLEQVDAALEGHLSQLRQLAREGRLHTSGRFPDGAGFLEIFEAADRVEAEDVARATPLVEDGLGSWIVREWEELKPASRDFLDLGPSAAPLDEK